MRRILVGILHGARSRVEFERSVNGIIERNPIYKHNTIEYSCGIMDLISTIPDDGRNIIGAKAINEKYNDILLLDDDMIHPRFALHDMLMHREFDSSDVNCIIGGMYTSRKGTHIHAYTYKQENGLLYPHAYVKPYSGLYECAAIGSGCMLIPVSIIKNMPFPWFSYKYEEVSSTNESVKTATIKVENKYYSRFSEDIYFCNKAYEYGYKIYLDSGVNCYHVTTMAVGVNNDGKIMFNTIGDLIK